MTRPTPATAPGANSRTSTDEGEGSLQVAGDGMVVGGVISSFAGITDSARLTGNQAKATRDIAAVAVTLEVTCS